MIVALMGMTHYLLAFSEAHTIHVLMSPGPGKAIINY